MWNMQFFVHILFVLHVQEGKSTTAAVQEKSATSTPLWSRSVGSMKCQLSGLVRPKTSAQCTASSTANCSTTASSHANVTCVNNTNSEQDGKNNSENNKPNSSDQRTSGSNVVSTGLAGLGAYSSSSGSENEEESS